MKTKHHLAHSEAASQRTVFVKWNHFTQFAALAIAAFTLSPALAALTPAQQAYSASQSALSPFLHHFTIYFTKFRSFRQQNVL